MNKVYKDYLGVGFVPLSGLARQRVEATAPLLGGMTCPALEYTWSVSDDGGETFRNPTDEEKAALRREVPKYCYDCGAARKCRADAVIMPCGHVAHRDCHVTDGKITCPYAKTVDPERVNDYEEFLPAGGGAG